MERIERTALKNLIHNEDYCRKVLPFIKEEYFTDRLEKLLFTEIYKFVNKYNNLPTKESLSIEINSNKSINEDEYKQVTDILSTLNPEPVNLEWLVETTEKFCKDRSIHNAVLNGIQIIDGKDKKHTPEYLPELLSNALSVSFDQKVGHDYFSQTTRLWILSPVYALSVIPRSRIENYLIAVKGGHRLGYAGRR